MKCMLENIVYVTVYFFISITEADFDFKKAFNQYLQLDGPPEANVFLSVAEDGYMSKWEITSDWDDISSMFM